MKKTFKTLFTVFMAVIAGFFFFGCTETEDFNGTWNTISFEKDGVAQEIVPSNIILASNGNKLLVAGESGVNLYNGTVRMSNGKISLMNLGSTKMMGSPEEMAFEDMFLEALSYAETYTLENDVLTICAPGKNMKLQFKK